MSYAHLKTRVKSSDLVISASNILHACKYVRTKAQKHEDDDHPSNDGSDISEKSRSLEPTTHIHKWMFQTYVFQYYCRFR